MTRLALLPDRVFDSTTGQMLEDHVVLVDGQKVIEVTPTHPEDVTPLPGVSLIPGLVDVHTHLAVPLDNGQGFAQLVERNGAQDALLGVKHASTTLRAGFTSVRDATRDQLLTSAALVTLYAGGHVIYHAVGLFRESTTAFGWRVGCVAPHAALAPVAFGFAAVKPAPVN